MFQRRNSGALPTTSPIGGGGSSTGGFALPFGGKNNGGMIDGSGKGIKMDAPVVKAWKQSSSTTKNSYYAAVFFVFLTIYSVRSLFYWNASIWLTCHQQECTLEVTPPGTKTITVVFARTQLHSGIAIKQDAEGNFVELDSDKYEAPKRHGKKKTPSSSKQKGPDEKGLYRTYRIKLLEKSPDNTQRQEGDAPDGDLSPIRQFLQEEVDGTWSMHFRRFGLSQTRTRVRANVNKIESYIKKRRQKLLLKESAALPWYGILGMIFGLLGFMITLLVGQFWDEAPVRQGGPGARRRNAPASSSSSARGGSVSQSKQRPTFVVDTGRPSKYPPGYRPQKKY